MEGIDRRAPQDLTTFRDAGVLTLSNVLGGQEVAELRGHFWDTVTQKFDIRLEDPDTWFANPYNPMGGSRAKRLSGMNSIMDGLRATGRLQPAQDAIQSALDTLFGERRWEPIDRWYSLLSFPGVEPQWSVPHKSWHNDEPIVVGDDEPWSIFVFLFLDRVERNTGPTLAITGSHRRGEVIAEQSGVVDELQVQAFDHVNSDVVTNPANVRLLPVGELLPQLVTADEWFGDLVTEDGNADRIHRFMESGTSRSGIHSRVVDLSADAGDVILFDPRCLHTFSANLSGQPRQVLRLDFRRTRPMSTNTGLPRLQMST